MVYNKVTINGTTIMDISSDTVTSPVLADQYTAHDAHGDPIVGTGSGGGGFEDVYVSTSGAVTQTLLPDKFYHFTGALTSLDLTVGSTGQYHFEFNSPSTAVVLTLPQAVIMPPSFAVEVNTKYEIDILDNYGVYAVWVYGGTP